MKTSRKLTIWKGDGMPLKSRKVLPNDPCPCGSGKKAKRCCGTETKYFLTNKKAAK